MNTPGKARAREVADSLVLDHVHFAVPEARRFDGAALGTRIKLLRELRGMSLQAVGDAAGLTKSHIWEMEKGRAVNPTVNAVWGISAALCVTPAMLLGLDDKMPPIDPVAMRIAGIADREIKRAVAVALQTALPTLLTTPADPNLPAKETVL